MLSCTVPVTLAGRPGSDGETVPSWAASRCAVAFAQVPEARLGLLRPFDPSRSGRELHGTNPFASLLASTTLAWAWARDPGSLGPSPLPKEGKLSAYGPWALAVMLHKLAVSQGLLIRL